MMIEFKQISICYLDKFPVDLHVMKYYKKKFKINRHQVGSINQIHTFQMKLYK